MINVAVVGAGAWGKNHIRVFSEIPKVRLKYICDRIPQNWRLCRRPIPNRKG